MAKKLKYREYTIERCYKQYTPPQIASLAEPPTTDVHVAHGLPTVQCECGMKFNPKFIAKHRRERCANR